MKRFLYKTSRVSGQLTREGEIELARQMESAKIEIIEALLAFSVDVQELLKSVGESSHDKTTVAVGEKSATGGQSEQDSEFIDLLNQTWHLMDTALSQEQERFVQLHDDDGDHLDHSDISLSRITDIEKRRQIRDNLRRLAKYREQIAQIVSVIESGVPLHRVGIEQCDGEIDTTLTQRLLHHIAVSQQKLNRAKNLFIESNLKLVITIATRYRDRGMPLFDMVQEGNLGLMNAVERFDHRLGYKFSTYATWWIRQSIVRALDEKSRIIRIPVHILEKKRRLSNIEGILRNKSGQSPAGSRVPDYLEMPSKSMDAIRSVVKDPVSFDAPCGQSSKKTIGEFIADDDITPQDSILFMRELNQQTKHLLEVLSPRENEILRMRFGIGKGESATLKQIGEHFGVSRERIRQIENEALGKLRALVDPDLLRQLIDN